MRGIISDIRDQMCMAYCSHCGTFHLRWFLQDMRWKVSYWAWGRCINCHKVVRVAGVNIRPKCHDYTCCDDAVPF